MIPPIIIITLSPFQTQFMSDQFFAAAAATVAAAIILKNHPKLSGFQEFLQSLRECTNDALL